MVLSRVEIQEYDRTGLNVTSVCTGDLTIGKLPESHGEMRENPVLLEGFWIWGESSPKDMGLVSSFVTC